MIAQQDYLHFKQSMPINASIDCELYAFLVGGIERGTIWDMIVFTPSNGYSRVVNYDGISGVISMGVITVDNYREDYSSANYSGLAAIQRALLAQGETVSYIPDCGVDGDYLVNDQTDKFLSINGKKIKVTLGGPDELTITAVTISDEDAPEGSLEITDEDAQKLVGGKIV